MAETFPESIGKYKIEGILAKGGMGVVYRSTHPTLNKPVIIKKLTARKNSTNIKRFVQEAKILGELQNPNIVNFYDIFTEGNAYYIVEELVDGMAVDKILQKQTALSPQIAMLIIQDACYGLKFAHTKNIVHRDIKPGNILISKRAEIKITDFGIASETAGGDELTQSGVALGTPAYMPPEQFEDSAKVDCRADIYALGIMLYEMVTGTKPYPGTLSIETLNIIKKGKYISPRKIDKKIPWCVCHLIYKMLRPKAKNRYQSALPVLKAIKRYLKHYDVHSIRVQLAKIVLSKNVLKEIEYVPKYKKRNQMILIASGCAALFFLCVCGWAEGVFHRTILRHWYTPVSIEMKMPTTNTSGSDLPVKAFFFENDGDKIPEILNTRRTLTQLSEKKYPDEKNARNRTYNTKDVYLPHGDYRIKVVAGPYVWWKSFRVDKKTVKIQADFLKDMRRSITVKANAFNSQTGKEITRSTKFSVLYNGVWTSLDAVPAEKLISGNVWKFRAECDGFNTETFSLRLDWLQDYLYISANLSPIQK